MAKLTFTLDDGSEIEVPLEELLTLGRNDGNDVVVDDLRVSAKHAEISRNEDGYVVRDLGSRAGTFVNGARVDWQALRDGDRVEFGPLNGIFAAEASEITVVENRAGAQPPKGPKKGGKEGSPAKRAMNGPESIEPSSEGLSAVSVPDEETRLKLLAETERLQAEMTRLTAHVSELQTMQAERDGVAAELASLKAQRDAEKLRVQTETIALNTAEQELSAVEARLREANDQIKEAAGRLAGLSADEERHSALKAAVKDAEDKHGDWLVAIHGLTTDHARKDAELQRLTAATENVVREMEVVSAHKQETLAHLDNLTKERDQALKEREGVEVRLDKFRQEAAAAELRARDLLELVQAREDQIQTAEKKLEKLDAQRSEKEARIASLLGTEEKLTAAQIRLKAAEDRTASLEEQSSALANRQKEQETKLSALNSNIDAMSVAQAELESKLQSIATSTAEETSALKKVQAAGEAARKLNDEEKKAAEQALQAKRDELSEETRRLEAVTKKLEEMKRLVAEHAGIDQKLNIVKSSLQEHHTKHQELEAWLRVLEDKRSFLQHTVEGLGMEEEAVKGRVEVLRGREKDLRHEVETLRGREREERTKFEELRRLATEADAQNEKQRESARRSIDLAARELADLESKLMPLREWKDAMDKRYERLASLPEDSAEARDLWHEIEAEKSSLRGLIAITQDSKTRGVSLSEAVLRGLSNDAAAGEPTIAATPHDETKLVPKKGKLSARVRHGSEPEASPTGVLATGALLSGVGAEMTLNSRLTRLRESVQRETSRLEFLRQERTREEARNRSGNAAGEALMKEHERQIEARIRREEEHLSSIIHKAEATEAEEHKRRERIAEMEKRLTELKADIAEAERERGNVRHTVDIVATELKNYEDGLDRLKKMGDE